MSWWLLLCTLTTILVLLSSAEERRVHRLVGGHLKVHHDDSNDAELLETLASGSKNKKSRKNGDEEEKKTLSQQVADGKYGLIQKELFQKPSKRPGVLSYDHNSEVPKDNVNNLGGLTKNEIWLAENHLLVLRGGTYPPHDDKTDNTATAWPAIDDYKAPLRQVKIPAHPKVPPPFPVQLTDDGPLQILGTNSSRTLNGSLEEGAFALPPPEGYDIGQYPANATSGQAPFPVPPYPQGEYLPGPPFPQLNGTLPPFFASLPPGAAILPPPNAEIDEDDPSIYYPPPYSFYYPKDNSSAVPAGPLVPGIVLPPPPNFFAPLEETTKRKPMRQRVKTTTTTTPLPQIQATTTQVPPTEKKPIRIHVHEINNELTPPRKRPTRPPTVTILKPVRPNVPKVFVYNNDNVKTIVSTTQVPLKVHYTTSNEIETNSITSSPEKYTGRRVKTTTKSPAQYYFYEEPSTRKPYYDIPKEYYLPPKQPVQEQKFVYVQSRPYNTQRPRYRFVQTPKTDTFSVHIARLQKQIHQYVTTSRPSYKSTYSPKPVYQFSFQAANYQKTPENQDKFRPLPKYSVQIQPAIEIFPTTTESPKYYDFERKKRPVSQFSFEVTQNPLYQNFYTKPEEGYFDENTRNYFTTFGQKLSATTAVPQRQKAPQSLEGDTAVNYLPPRPTINPDAEFLPNYPQFAQESRQKTQRQPPNSYISYQLPGDQGAHFYFITPQLAQSQDQGAGYYYSQPNVQRVRRNKER